MSDPGISSLGEAITAQRLQEFIAQVEGRGIAAANVGELERAIRLLVTRPLPRDRTSRSTSRGGSSREADARRLTMAKELRTAEQLADLVVAVVSVAGLYITVRKDHAYGWQPTVVSSPGDTIGHQRRVEEIANRLRVDFDLRE